MSDGIFSFWAETTIHTHTHTYGQLRRVDSPISLWTVGANRSAPEKKPMHAQGEQANSRKKMRLEPRTFLRWGSSANHHTDPFEQKKRTCCWNLAVNYYESFVKQLWTGLQSLLALGGGCCACPVGPSWWGQSWRRWNQMSGSWVDVFLCSRSR